MDKQRLNELAAKAMGWHKGFYASWEDDNGKFMEKINKWNPAECADDALALLENMADMNAWVIESVPTRSGLYFCRIDAADAQGDEKTLPLAMLVCALRCFGTPKTK